MFGKLYLGEIKKLCRPKTAIVFVAIMLFAVIAMTLIYTIDLNAMIDASNDYEQGVVVSGTTVPDDKAPIYANLELIVTKEEAPYVLESLKEELVLAKKHAKQDGFYYFAGLKHSSETFNNSTDMVYQLKATITAYEFVIANPEYYNKPLYIYAPYDAGTLMLGMMDKHTTNYIGSLLATLSTLILVYGLVVGSAAYTAELKSGTLKLVLLRPITRNQLTLAKLFAMLTIVTVSFVALFLLLLIIGAIAFAEPQRAMLYIFNAGSAYVSTEVLGIFYTFMFSLMQIWAYTIAAFGISTLIKSRVLGIILPFGANLLVTLVRFTGLGRFWFADCANLGQFFGFGSYILCGGNFIISILMLILYMAAFIAGTFAIVNKRDIA